MGRCVSKYHSRVRAVVAISLPRFGTAPRQLNSRGPSMHDRATARILFIRNCALSASLSTGSNALRQLLGDTC